MITDDDIETFQEDFSEGFEVNDMTLDDKIEYLESCKDSFRLGMIYSRMNDLGAEYGHINWAVDFFTALQEDLYRLKDLEK